MERRRAFRAGSAAVAAVLALWPALAGGGDGRTGQAEVLSSVTDAYTLEGLLPLMPPAVADGLEAVASWCRTMAESFKDHSSGTKKRIDFQRDAKEAEIKVLEARAREAGSLKDEVLKKGLEDLAEVQELDRDVLDAVKDMAEAEIEAAERLEQAREAVDKFVAAYRDLARNRAEARGIDYAENEAALKSFAEAGKTIKDAGERLEEVAKARQDLNKAWQKLLKAKFAG
jgi:hypothetical protein